MVRLDKALKNTGLLIGVLGVCAATIYGSVYVANLGSPKAPQACPAGHHVDHKVIIQNNRVVPGNTVAPRCDNLTITNLDKTERLVAFGPHEHHVAYDGILERVLKQGQNVTVTLVQPGSFRFHDHWHDEVQGTFTVTKSS